MLIGLADAQDEKLIARGKYLIEGVVACGNCHAARDEKGEPLATRGLSGGMVFDEPPFNAYAPNITPDTATGIGKWTDAQLAKAIREGIRPDGASSGRPCASSSTDGCLGAGWAVRRRQTVSLIYVGPCARPIGRSQWRRLRLR